MRAVARPPRPCAPRRPRRRPASHRLILGRLAGGVARKGCGVASAARIPLKPVPQR